MKPTTDLQIKIWARKIRQSDRKAFDELFRWGYTRLVKFALSYTPDHPTACDLVQDAFVVLWQKRDKIDPEQSLKAYLYRIVRNRCLNHLRNRNPEIVDSEMINPHNEGTTQMVEPGESGGSSNGTLENEFSRWIAGLPGRQREAFKLSRFEGLDHDEIAEVMDVSPKTVNNHIVAALRELRGLYRRYQKENSNGK